MKYAVILIVIVWFLCGVAGAWMLDDLNRDHWKTILRGPITLARAVNDNPVTVGPD
jgi:hypothetical protein